MSILNEPKHIVRERLIALFDKVDSEGGWPEYAEYFGTAALEEFSTMPELYEAFNKLAEAIATIRSVTGKLYDEYEIYD